MKTPIVIINLLIFPFIICAQQFTGIESGPVVSDGGDSRAVNWIDYDNDGDPDLFITNGPSAGQNNFFYENNGDGTFTKIDNLLITRDGASSDGSTWADINNDGFDDLFVANWYGKSNLMYINNGDKTFSFLADTVSNSGGYSESASWADIDGDAFVDLFVANSGGDLKNFVYLNQATEKFSRISGIPISDDGGTSRHMDFADFDNDGLTDLFVPNENNEQNFLYHSGINGFTRVNDGEIVTNTASSFGSSWGDYDNDGDLDLFVANWGNQNNYLYMNNGNGSFSKISEGVIVNDHGYSIGSAWADVDNDGDLDLFVANAFSTSAANNFLYFNNGDGSFTKDTSMVSTEKGWGYGAAFGDYNRDGYLDLAVAKCFNASENNALYVNNGGSFNWITLKLSGTVSNSSAIGGVVHLKAVINGKDTWQMRHVSGQNGYCGQNLELHFGLGDASQADSIKVQWPSGQVDILDQVAINQVLNIQESVPQGFLRPHFKADKRMGFGKTVIKFNDLSIFDENMPIIAYAWDFDGDDITDSMDENPLWEYDSLGVFTVKLTVSNGQDSFSKTFNDYITIRREPGAPVILSSFPAAFDTTIAKREEIEFKINAVDTSLYPLNYFWSLNGIQKSTDTTYAYRASSFNVPRTDTVSLDVSNGYNTQNRQWLIRVVNDVLSLETENKLQPLSYQLNENFPNPFNPSTTIKYTVPGNQSSSIHVSIAVYDLIGREVAHLVNKDHYPGEYAVTFDAGNLSSGIYYYQMKSGTFNQVKPMVLLK